MSWRQRTKKEPLATAGKETVKERESEGQGRMEACQGAVMWREGEGRKDEEREASKGALKFGEKPEAIGRYEDQKERTGREDEPEVQGKPLGK